MVCTRHSNRKTSTNVDTLQTCKTEYKAFMKLEKHSKAYKAYEKGKEAAINGLGIKSNPYKTTNRYIHMSNWFEKGYNEAELSSSSETTPQTN
jgi:hypothetical protein